MRHLRTDPLLFRFVPFSSKTTREVLVKGEKPGTILIPLQRFLFRKLLGSLGIDPQLKNWLPKCRALELAVVSSATLSALTHKDLVLDPKLKLTYIVRQRKFLLFVAQDVFRALLDTMIVDVGARWVPKFVLIKALIEAASQDSLRKALKYLVTIASRKAIARLVGAAFLNSGGIISFVMIGIMWHISSHLQTRLLPKL
eukprot:TRINITY_DN917_c0_g1_i1.p1 TRINITY_DN917_c0_g1~~TRINITY_DN917_c0_g1_i1.p1  ORF type:complete len:199 (-),score=14.05 TRINITY_DN917_c0_g1_i1:65-661(-)